MACLIIVHKLDKHNAFRCEQRQATGSEVMLLVAFLASFALDPGNALSGYTAALHKPTARLGNRCSFT